MITIIRSITNSIITTTNNKNAISRPMTGCVTKTSARRWQDNGRPVFLHGMIGAAELCIFIISEYTSLSR